MPCDSTASASSSENHTFGPNFFLNAKYAYLRMGLRLRAARRQRTSSGGIDCVDRRGVRLLSPSPRRKPWHIVDVDGSVLRARSSGGQHEFKFGFGYRRNPARPTTTVQRQPVSRAVNHGRRRRVAQVTRQRSVALHGEHLERPTSATASPRAA